MPAAARQWPRAPLPSAPDAGHAGVEALREWVVAREGAIRGRDLPAPLHAELLPQHVAVRLRRSRRDPESLADLVVRAPCGDQLHDLPLAFGEVDGRLGNGGGHASESSSRSPG